MCSKIGGGFRGRVLAEELETQVKEMEGLSYRDQFHHQHVGVVETFGNCIGVRHELIDRYDILQMLMDYRGNEKDFFYHSDHLGSAAYLTTGSQVTQTLNYLPYGEDWVDIQNYAETHYPRLGIYTYNGKEKDYESGFHYYGARYCWSEVLTGWLSVDPMADKYPSLSPYNYCVWNPIKLTDSNGEFPRLPYFIRVATSKHVYSDIAYKIKHGGSLDVWEHPSGCIFASVQSNNVSIDESGAAVIEVKMFRPEGYTSEAQIKATTDLFVNAESWMDEPATSIADFGLKTATNVGYSLANEPTKLLTGCSLAGTEATSNEMAEAFVGTAAGSLGTALSKGMGTIKTAGKTGLGQYNDFVRKMGNYQGRSKKEMGRLYQTNKELNSAVSTYDNFERGVAGTSVFRKEE